MADFRRGIEAGVVTGIIYLAISAILGAIYQNNPLSVPHFLYGTGLTPLFLLSALTNSSYVTALLLQYVVRGIVFGAVFAALYSFLPGTASVKKGVVLSAFLWMLSALGLIYMTPGLPADGILALTYWGGGGVVLSSLSTALAGIISALFFGALTGFLWNRFRAKRVAEARKASPVLLLSFILGGLMWVLPVIGFIIVAVIQGTPAIGPEFWWSDLLLTLVGFLGFLGWVLSLVGWRKTKVGKSGFGWGVAGGVIMALTPCMLLPGTLAIIGGVFSRHKPVTESVTAEIGQ